MARLTQVEKAIKNLDEKIADHEQQIAALKLARQHLQDDVPVKARPPAIPISNKAS